jgi:hypothetical protein
MLAKREPSTFFVPCVLILVLLPLLESYRISRDRRLLIFSLTMVLLCCGNPEWSDGEEVEDASAENLSYVGLAAYEVLRKRHNRQHHKLWNVTSGTVVGELHQTPLSSFRGVHDPDPGHSDWFPIKMAEIMARTEYWCDVMSLGPPDGLFMEKFQEALATISERAAGSDKKVTIRMMFGNIIGMPVNCDAVIKKLTENLPENSNIRLWVGAWRKGISWNHAKLIAVDGLYLHTGTCTCATSKEMIVWVPWVLLILFPFVHSCLVPQEGIICGILTTSNTTPFMICHLKCR